MQIDRYNHLLFPRDSSNPTTSGKQPASAAIAPALAKPQAIDNPVRDGEGVPDSSVVLKIQLSDRSADAPVYSNGRKSGVFAREPDFVALAVSAMREFSDEHERQKVRGVDANATPAANPAPAETPWTALKGLQQFAAKLNVFA